MPAISAVALKVGNFSATSHVSFGSVLGRDGRPLKTREGTAVELGGLLDEAEQLGLEKYRASYADRKAHGHDVPHRLLHAGIEWVVMWAFSRP